MNWISHSHLRAIPENSVHSDAQQEACAPQQSSASTRFTLTGRAGGNTPSASIVSDTPAVIADRASSSSISEGSTLTCYRGRKLLRIITFSVGLTLLVMISIILVVFLGPNRSIDEPDNSSADQENIVSASPASQAPSSDTLAQPLTPEMIRQVDEVLTSISSPEDLANMSSPQYKAREWLLTRDLLIRDVIWEGTERLSQRYIAELVFWALTDNATKYLKADTSECDWQGYSCPERGHGHILTSVNLNELSLRGSLPDEFYLLSTLNHLAASKNNISGTLSRSIGNWENLQSLDLSENDLSGTIPEALWGLPDMRYVYLCQNRFIGQIKATNLSAESKLVDIWIYDNDLTGTLPEALFESAKRLRTWTAYSNRFSGPIPHKIVSQSLSFFDVSYNILTGTLDMLADGLLNIPSLETMYLDNNQLEGTLTSNLNRESFVKHVWLHNNQLRGEIPSDFGILWHQLSELRIHSNNLRGNITDQCTSWPLLTTLEADCRVKSDGSVMIECNCCTDCV